MVTHAVAPAHNCTSAVWTGGKTPFQLYITLNYMPIISSNQLLPHSSPLACLSYDRVMDTQNDFRRAVSKQVTGDSVVVPTNIKSCVFVTNVVSNLDESGRWHCHDIDQPSHTWQNWRRPTTSQSSWGEHIQLPIGYAVVPHIDEYAGDVTLLSTTHTQRRPVLMQGYLKNRGSKIRIRSTNEMQHSATRWYQTMINGWEFPIFNEKAPLMQK